MNKKYIIKITFTENNQRYVRKIYDNSWSEAPMLTPTPHMIDGDCLFDSKDAADKELAKLIKLANNRLEIATEHMNSAQNTFGNSYDYRLWRTMVCKEKKLVDRTNYEIEEFTPEFICDTKKKRVKDVWKKDVWRES